MSGALQAFDRLWRALERSAAASGCIITLAGHSTAPWRSVTFCGGQHTIHLVADAGDVLRRWAAGLAEDRLTVPGHLLADLVVSEFNTLSGRSHFSIEALTVEVA